MLFLPELTPGGRKLKEKIKQILIILAGLCLVIFLLLFLLVQKENRKLEKEKIQLERKLNLVKLKAELKDSPSQQKAQLQKKDAQSFKKEVSYSVCQQCFQQYKYQLEVKDEKGRWIFQDPDVFDPKPGKLILTEHFWKEIEKLCEERDSFLKTSQLSPSRHHLQLALEWNQYQIGYKYTPLAVSLGKAEFLLSFYLRAGFSFQSQFLGSQIGAVFELGF